MPKNNKTIHDMLDYVHQLRRHTEGRRAIHVRLSALEKHFREEHYRRFVATALRPLITNYGATMFALPNTDIVLMVKGATVDTIDPLLNNIRRKYKDAAMVKTIDPIQGVSDAFVEWFDLEEAYVDFVDYTKSLADRLLGSGDLEGEDSKNTQPRKRTPGMLEINARPVEPLKPSAQIKMVKIERENTESDTRYLDAEITRSIVNALSGADVTGMVRKQRVMAILGEEAALPVMVHRFVPPELAFETLLERPIVAENRWLLGYVEGFLADRLLASMPSMENEQSIASSIRLTCESVCSKKFGLFDQAQGKRKRSSLIIEFSALDVMANFSSYLEAHENLDDLGYKVAIADVDIRMLPLLDYSNLRADFIKLVTPQGEGREPLKPEIRQMVQDHVHKIGLARIILDSCTSDDDVSLGQRLGITLFQGIGVEPRSAN